MARFLSAEQANLINRRQTGARVPDDYYQHVYRLTADDAARIAA
jgi:hypothetical protein